MTRENIKQYLLQIKQKDGEEVLSNRWQPDILVEIIDKIYDEHEAQMKEANRIKEDFRKVALDLDAEASELREQMKAKDEEIIKLKLEVLSSFPKIANTKSRKIIAMLFWMMKRQKAIYIKSFNELGINSHNTSFYKGAYENSKMRFKQAYKILKDKA